MAFPEYEQLRYTCRGASGGYYSMATFWFSSSPLKPQTPIRQRSNGGNLLYYPLTAYYRVGNGYYENAMVLFIRAQTLIDNKCTWAMVNQLTQRSGSSFYSITTSDFDNAISNGWSSDYVSIDFNKTTYNSVQEKIDAMRAYATRDYWRQTMLDYYRGKGYDLNPIIDELMDNSVACIISLNTKDAILGDNYNSMGPICRSGSGGGAYPINGGADFIFTFCPIEGSKVTARSYIHTNNNYANFYGSPSICLTEMKIAIGDISNANLKPVNLGSCTTGPRNDLAGVTGFTTAFDNINSVYAKRNGRDEQQISGALNFTGNLTVKTPGSQTSISSKIYADSVINKNVILNQIVQKGS